LHLATVAVLSDIHGNLHGLEAVLADAQAHGVQGYVVLGDLAAIGAQPVEVLQRLAGLPNARFVQGNTDRYLVTGERPYPSVQHAQADVSLVQRLVDVATSFSWTHGALAASPGSWLAWLGGLPLEQRFSLADGTRALAVHVAPGRDDGPGIHPALAPDELSALVADCAADLLLVGHTHWPLDVRAGGVRIVNVGSVSNPWAPDVRASYVLLNGDEITFRRVAYDIQAALDALAHAPPALARFAGSFLRGEREPWWASSAGRAWAGHPRWS
jgi:predicted phosphodiesterase